MNTQKITIYTFSIILLLFIILYAIFESGRSSYYVYQAKESRDLSYCNKIPFFKIYFSVTRGMVGPNINIRTQQKHCRNQVLRVVDSEEDLEIYSQAIKENNPELCLTLPDDSTIYTNQKFSCITEINKRYMDESICEYYTKLKSSDKNSYTKYNTELRCNAEIIISKKQDADFCENYEFGLREYCYFNIMYTYNSLRRTKDSLVIDVAYPDGTILFNKKPEVPYICDKIFEKAKKGCIISYEEYKK